MYEESIRVPLLVRYPRLIRQGRRVDEMTLNVDLAPTLLELIGQPGADDMQGLSVLGALRGSGTQTPCLLLSVPIARRRIPPRH